MVGCGSGDDSEAQERAAGTPSAGRANYQQEEIMKRLAAIVAAAALVGGLGGAGIAFALGGSNDSAEPEPTSSVAEPASPVRDEGLAPEAIYKRAAPSVVVISATQNVKVPATFFAPSQSEKVQVGGSGFVIDHQGDIVTNDHVVQDATNVRVGFSGGASYPAKVVGTDPSTDLAVIRVDAPASALHPLAFADSTRAEVGDAVYAIGNPFGLDRTMTAGIVSATGRDIQAPNGLGIPNAIQTDAPINHGNSGGPLLDASGRVVGINDQIESGGTVDGNVGVGFAIASNTAKTIVPDLLAHGHVAHAWLGIEVAPLNPDVAKAVQGVPDHGVLIVKVVAGSPAARAGLSAGSQQRTLTGESVLVGADAILAVGGRPIEIPAQLEEAVQSHHPGDELRLQVTRDGQIRTVTVRLGNAPSSG
jgi:putative serine protease PepD